MPDRSRPAPALGCLDPAVLDAGSVCFSQINAEECVLDGAVRQSHARGGDVNAGRIASEIPAAAAVDDEPAQRDVRGANADHAAFPRAPQPRHAYPNERQRLVDDGSPW
jgi:hypothetical protein